MPRSIDLVVPTVGRESLALLLASLDGPPERLPNRIILVDDRRSPREALPMGAISPELRTRLAVVSGGGRGAGAARNAGWQASRAQWVVFLDEDILPCRGWLTELAEDLAARPAGVAGSRGRLQLPAPRVDADIAYRTSVLRRLGGFDERLVGRSCGDADLARRARAAGFHVVAGRRTVVHPVWPARPWASLRAQAGTADDVLMRALHGRDWRGDDAAKGALLGHVAITMAGALAVAGVALGDPLVAAGGFVAWLGGTTAVAWRRIERAPRRLSELGELIVTGAALPAAAVWHRLAGEMRTLGARRYAHVQPRVRLAGAARSIGAHT